MTSTLAKFSTGPANYEAVEAIDGTQFVEARAGGVSLPGVGVAAAGSVKVVGIAQKPASPTGGAPRVPVAGVLNVTLAPTEVAVYDNGQTVPNVLFSGAAAYGDRLVVGANGGVAQAGATPDARAIVGWCKSRGGVAAGARGVVKLTL